MNSLTSSSSSSSPSSAYRSSVPSIDTIPEELFMQICSFITKADNQSLASLASTSKDCWRMLSVDSLRSFFYAGHAAFTVATPENKSEIIKALVDWLGKVKYQLPAETSNTMWDMLITMSDTDDLKLEAKFPISISILESVKPLLSKEPDTAPSIEKIILVNKACMFYSKTVNSLSLQALAVQAELSSMLGNF